MAKFSFFLIPFMLNIYPHLTKCRTEQAGYWDSAKISYPASNPNTNNL